MSQVTKRRIGGVVISVLALLGVAAFVQTAHRAAGQPQGEQPPNPLAALFGLSESRQRAQVARVRNDLRMLAVAIEAYYIDNNMYPAYAMGAQSLNSYLGKGTAAAQMPGFRVPSAKLATLTTPIAYITGLPTDVFSTSTKATYAYWSIVGGQTDPAGKIVPKPAPGAPAIVGWILVSPGPDGDYDLLGEWDVYDPAIEQPSPRLLGGANKKGDSFTYDPTNGTVSNGDIWRVKM
jgi:type II secretory pathway pseudopilin PulG